MSQVIEYLQALVKECTDRKIRASVDPRSVAPPCVLFTPPSLSINTFQGATASFTALVLAPSPGNLDAFAMLDRMAQDVVRGVLPDVTSITPVEFTPDSGVAYPALQLEWETSLDWPDPYPEVSTP